MTNAEWRERVAAGIERIATSLSGPDHALVTRVATMEDLLKEFVGVMDNPRSTDQEWLDLLADVKTALGTDAT